MRMLSPGNRIPQVHECVKNKERRSNLRGRSRVPLNCKPRNCRSGDQIGRANIADEMRIEWTGFRNAGDRVVPIGRHGQHRQTIGRQAYPENPRDNIAHTAVSRPDKTVQRSGS